jgi:hypothetical protein
LELFAPTERYHKSAINLMKSPFSYGFPVGSRFPMVFLWFSLCQQNPLFFHFAEAGGGPIGWMTGMHRPPL